MYEDDMKQVANFIDEGIKIAVEANKKLSETTKPTGKAFREFLPKDPVSMSKIEDLKKRVEEFAGKFPIPGFDDK